MKHRRAITCKTRQHKRFGFAAKIGLASAALFLGALCRIALAQGDADLAARVRRLLPPPRPSVPHSFKMAASSMGAAPGSQLRPTSSSKGNIIARVSSEPVPVDPTVIVIPANGGTLMPGLIDALWHAIMASVAQPVLMTADPNYLQRLAARQAGATLMRGFTSVARSRSPVFGLKRAIDEGVRASIPQEPSSHKPLDMEILCFSFELPRHPGKSLSYTEVEGIALIADSPDEVRLRAREQLRAGASQIKLMAGGGVASPYNPIESTQFTEPEIRAAVEAAENWGAYVTVQPILDARFGRRSPPASSASTTVNSSTSLPPG